MRPRALLGCGRCFQSRMRTTYRRTAKPRTRQPKNQTTPHRARLECFCDFRDKRPHIGLGPFGLDLVLRHQHVSQRIHG